MLILIKRKYNEKETLGYGAVMDGAIKLFDFNTIELPNLGNQHNISCIPEGEYDCHKITSPTKGKCFQIMDVFNRTAVLIHVGNYATGKKVDTEGCILVGNAFADINADGELDVINSTITLNRLLNTLPIEFKLVITHL
jgi:hypothetical protein